MKKFERVILFLMLMMFQTTAFAYSNCFDHVSQFIQDKSPRAQARLAAICKKTDPMIVICGLDFRHELPSLMQTPETFEMAIDTCANESHSVVMCTRSRLFEGPRNAPPAALEQAIRSCFE